MNNPTQDTQRLKALYREIDMLHGIIDNLKAENARLTRELAELTEYTDIVKRSLFALIDQRKS